MVVKVFNNALNKWGVSKLVQVIGWSLMGAAFGAIVSSAVIPDESIENDILEEKENESC